MTTAAQETTPATPNMKNQAKCGSCHNANLNTANPTKLTTGDSGKAGAGNPETSQNGTRQPNSEYVRKQLEDVVVPRLSLSVIERPSTITCCGTAACKGNSVITS
jgi:hypothetical protein